MAEGPFYEALEQKIKALEKEARETKLIEKSFLREKHYSESVIDSLPGVFYFLDDKGKFLGWNKNLREISGYSNKEISKMNPLDFFVEEDKGPVADKIREVFVKGESFVEAVVLTKTGNKINFHFTGRRVQLDNKSYLVGMGIDITERKRAENRIRHLNSLYEDLLVLESIDKKLKRITDGVVEIFGADFSRIWITWPGDRCESDCVHAKVTDGPHICRYRDRCLHLQASSGRYTHIDGEVHRRVPFGCYKIGRVAASEEPKFLTNDVVNDPNIHNPPWAKKLGLISFAGYRIVSDEGVPMGVLALFSKRAILPDEDALIESLANIAAQVIQKAKSDDALQESEERYRLLFDLSINPINLFDKEGTLLLINQSSARYFGGTPDDFIGKSLIDLLPNQADELMKKHHQVFESGQGLEFEFCEDFSVGRRWFLSTVYPIRNAVGEIFAVQVMSYDITDRKRAEEALKEGAEKIKLFAYSVSHDLKNPTIGINLLTKQLHRKYKNILDEKGKNYCDQILKASEQLATLVERINVYISTKEAPLIIEKVNLNQVFDTVRDEFSAQILVRQISWSQPENLLEINVDRLSILRAIRNFVDNALKYGGDELSEIEIRYEESDEFHILSIKDDGIGIDEKESKNIFRPFARSVTSIGIEGTGLGLAIANEIANQHKGKVWIEPGLEKGVIFYMSISKDLRLTK